MLRGNLGEADANGKEKQGLGAATVRLNEAKERGGAYKMLQPTVAQLS